MNLWKRPWVLENLFLYEFNYQSYPCNIVYNLAISSNILELVEVHRSDIIHSRQEYNIFSFFEICFIFQWAISQTFSPMQTQSHFDDIAFPSIIECIHICLLLAGWSHWWWHISVVTPQMCRHFRTFSCRYSIFIKLCKSLRKTLTSLLPGFVDSLQMVSLPERSKV